MNAMLTKEQPAIEQKRIRRLQISNFMRVKALTVDLDGNHLLVTGPNAAGKTSTVDAIFYALAGASDKAVPEPIHDGEERAIIRIDLGDLIVERRYTPKTTTLIVTTPEGDAVKQPQKLLEKLMGRYSLDPIAFSKLRPRDQVDEFLRLAGVEPPVEQVLEITGEKHPAKSDESADAYLGRLCADDVGIYYVQRRQVGRDLDQKRQAALEQSEYLAKLGGPVDAIESSGSASAILKELDGLQAQADQRRNFDQEAETLRADLTKANDRLAGIVAEEATCLNEEQKTREQIKALEEILTQLKAKRAGLTERMAKGDLCIAQIKEDLAGMERARDQIPDPSHDIANARQRLASLEQEQKSIQERRFADEHLTKLETERDAIQKRFDGAEKILKSLRELKAALLDGLDFGVKGISIGEGELRLHGRPFRQASLAEVTEVSCLVAMRQNPQLRLLRLDEGECLDPQSRERLFALADRYGFQVVMTAVSQTDSDLKVEIVEANSDT